LSRGRVGIVTAYGYLDTLTIVCDIADELAAASWDVDIWTDQWGEFRVARFTSSRIRVHVRRRLPSAFSGVPSSEGDPRRALALIDHAAAIVGSMGRGLRISWRAIDFWVRHRRRPFTVLIGVDPDGLVRSEELSRLAPVPIAYQSLELLMTEELETSREARLKAKERRLSRRAPFVIIQDDARKALLAADNGIPDEKFVLIPNAPRGPAARRRSGYWHRRFDLAEGTRVLLHAGSADSWTGIDQIVAGAAEMPPNWVLVVHTRFDPQAADATAFRALQSSAGPRVHFSSDPVPRQRFPELIDGADAGIAFYRPTPGSVYTQTNIATIGLSSGKVSSYLRGGLPVIVNDASTLGDLVARERIGVAVASGREVGAAVAEIAGDYDGYSGRAVAFFDRELDLRRSITTLVRRLDT
jgi:glycosyltransferase involved in cell wall biosynthesis